VSAIEPDETVLIEHPVILQPFVYQLAETLEEAGVVKASAFLLAAQRVLERQEQQRREVMRRERARRKGRRFFRR
jgi:hypothetical protein